LINTLSVDPVAGHTGGRLSTWQSFARGATSEIDYLNGEVVRLGRLHGVATPVNERLQRLLGVLWENGNGAAPESLAGLLGAEAEPVDDRGVVA
jgi:2-dehydropantoate 2-reductase